MTSEKNENTKSTKKKNVTDDDLYRHTSQFRLWSFTREEFKEKQFHVHEKASNRIKATLTDKNISSDVIDSLTLEEELGLIKFYSSKVEEIAKVFHMPSQVKATAISYFRKFYLVYSVMDYHPKNMLYTCVFLASKSENYFIPIDKFCAPLDKTETAHILDLEFLVLQSLSFTLAVQNPLKALHGFFLDLQSILADSSKSELGKLHDNARQILVQGFITDAQFFYTPPQIALAALYMADKGLINKYLKLKYDLFSEELKFLANTLERCKADLLDTKILTRGEGKAIDKKLYACTNPDKYMNSAKRKLEKAQDNGSNESSEIDTSVKRVKIDEREMSQ